jgi:hypothetical protein
MIMGIIISIVITGLVFAMSWVAGTQAQATANLSKMDAAFYAAESGAQRVAWYCKNGKMSSIASPLTGTVNGFAYSSSWTTVSGTIIKITSIGSLGSVSYTMSETVAPPAPSAPQLANAGNGNISGAVTINGNQQTNGTINTGANLQVNGNLSAGGSINGSPAVSGTKTASATGLNPPSVSAIYTAVKALATHTLTNPSSISTLDFTTASNGILFINGDANMSANVVVMGSGTVVVSGNWNQSGNFPNTGTASVNIVVQGDLNISGTLKINGSLYGGGNWNQSGAFTIAGIVLVHGDSNVSGSGTINTGTIPTFDPRTGGATTFTNFAGPLP